jgi:hypothetical protein
MMPLAFFLFAIPIHFAALFNMDITYCCSWTLLFGREKIPTCPIFKRERERMGQKDSPAASCPCHH